MNRILSGPNGRPHRPVDLSVEEVDFDAAVAAYVEAGGRRETFQVGKDKFNVQWRPTPTKPVSNGPAQG